MLNHRPVQDPDLPARAQLAVTEIAQHAGRFRITFAGEVDMATVACFDQVIGYAVRDPAAGRIEIDLRDVSFIDSCAVNTLVFWWRDAAARGRHLLVAHPRNVVRQVLEITGLLELLTTAPEATAARDVADGFGRPLVFGRRMRGQAAPMGDFLDKAKEFAEQHDDKVDEALERGGNVIDERTGGKYDEQVGKGVDWAQEHTGEGSPER